MSGQSSAAKALFWTVLVALMIWLPRGLALDRFVTADEHAWLARSGNFYRAFANGDYAATFQRHHPGVTVTWAGTLGFLTQYPDYAQEAPREFGWLTEEIEPFLEEHGHTSIGMLAAGRRFVVLFITLALLISFWMAAQLLGLRAALIGFGLIAFAPFHIGLSRLMHLDGLLSSFMLLAVLAYLVHLRRSPLHEPTNHASRITNYGYLVLSGVAAGLAWLTRSPGFFLGPFLGMVVLIGWWRERLTVHPTGQARQPILRDRLTAYLTRQARQLVYHFVGWAIVGGVIFVGLWPAMWVAPMESLGEVLNAARSYAAEGHLKPIFFNGEVFSGDPGMAFYLISFLWRVTPVMLIGLVVGLIGLLASLFRRTEHHQLDEPRKDSITAKERSTDANGPVSTVPAPTFTLLVLLLFAILFGLFMNLGDKKFDRYLLPAYLPLTLVAGWGWAWLFQLVFRQVYREGPNFGSESRGLLFAGALVVLGQAAFSLPTFPYYLSYYNPIMGGAGNAPNVMQIGWGEGADQAADALTAHLAEEGQPTEAVTVASAYTNGPFSYFFDGTTLPIYFWHKADYGVVYAQDFQRRLPGPRQIRYFEESTPMDTVRVDGLDYARLYDLRNAPLPDYVTDWQMADSVDAGTPQIRLVSYLFPSSRIAPGDVLPMTLYFENLAPIGPDLSVLVRLVGADGSEVARSEGWPQGRPTSTWTAGDTWADGHSLAIPPDTAAGIYRLDVSFYDPETLERLSATRPLTGELLGDTLNLDFVEIGHARPLPQKRIEPTASLGGLVSLNGISWVDEDGAKIEPETDATMPNEALTLILHWSTVSHLGHNQVVFAHVIGSDGTLLTQTDEQPWGGFYPTTFWSRGRTVVQPLVIRIPADAQSGEYAVHVGMYDSETVVRLPITRDGEAAGDSVIVARLKVGE